MKKIISFVWQNSDVLSAEDLASTILRLKYIIFGLDKEENGLRTTILSDYVRNITEVILEYTDSEPKDSPNITALPS